MKLILIIMSILFTTESGELKLDHFIFDDQEIPKGYKIKPILSDDHLPCNIQSNPYISPERIFIDCFINMMHLDSSIAQDVETGLFSIYEGQSDIGVFGISTSSDKKAEEILQTMKANNPNDNNSELFQSGKILIYLWQDKTRTVAFDEFKQLINARFE